MAAGAGGIAVESTTGAICLTVLVSVGMFCMTAIFCVTQVLYHLRQKNEKEVAAEKESW